MGLFMARTYQKTSVADHIAAVQAEMTGVKPPEHVNLRYEDVPFWEMIVKSRPAKTWHGSDLILAAQLARDYADLQKLADEVDHTGFMVDDKPNPLLMVQDRLHKRVLATARQLMINTVSTVGEQKTIIKARDNLPPQVSTDSDDLLAGFGLQ